MLELAGYKEKKQLYAGSRTIVYRAIRAKDSQTVIIKALRNPHPSFNELVKFRNQYIITRNLEHPRIVRPIALERYGNGYALVMPDSGAIALPEYWQQSSRSLAEFLDIAIQLAEALHYLSGQRIIHKDIKPANILINPESLKIQLIDFSISSLLPRERQQLTNPNILEGTLAYISPEQTGRMNRGIDYRTDFYSLGATFFELLTGKLPFESSDPMELVHCHIAKMPPALSRAPGSGGEREMGNGEAIPQVIENIVRRLMAKNAEERYQSALGLKYDLELGEQEWEATGVISQFELGTRDKSDRFLIPEKLYGREAEVSKLLAAFVRVASPQENRVAEGKSEMMLVAGFSGIGKTAVVNEVHKPIVRQRGYFIKGKFDQFNRNIPFSAFVQAFRDLMGQLLGSSDAELQAWKEKILVAVGENGQVLIEVIPELELIIGKQPSVPELSGSAAQNRFNLLFENFIAIFTTLEHPLVMFLDDLQWADSASLNLMKVLIARGKAGYLLLLGAYRDNEVYPAHPLMLALKELEKERAVISTIILEPLALHYTNNLVAETLCCSTGMAEPLTKLIYQKTKGNPFFTTQFLKGLNEDELIAFNLELGYWECDISKVRDAALTDDVVEFMAGRLALLPSATQNALKLAACIGNQFELETLTTICEESSEEVASDIWNALQEGLILPISEAYKFFQGDLEERSGTMVTVIYRFLHDRVQQAAYSLIAEAEKPETHLKIGQLLLRGTPESQREEKLFAIAGQLNKGRELLADERDRLELAELNLRAGRKAKAATAYSAALEYFKIGSELLAANRWQQQYDLTLSLSVGAAEVAYLQADFEEMERWGQEVLEKVNSLLDRVKIDKIKIQVFMAQNQPLRSVETALEALASLGINIPESPTPSEIEQVLTKTQTLCESRSFEELSELPVMTDPYKQEAIEILGLVVPPASIVKFEVFPIIICQQIILSLEYGNSPFSACAYANYGMMLCLLANIDLGYQFGQLSSVILERFHARELEAKVLMTFHGFIRFWKHHPRESIAKLLQAYRSGLEVGDVEFAAYASMTYCAYSFFIGSHLPELEVEVSTYSYFCRKIKLQPIVVKDDMLRQLVLNLIGGSENTHCLSGEVYDIETMIPVHQQAGDNGAIFYAYIWQMLLYYMFGHFQEAVENATLAEVHLDRLPPMLFTPIFYFYLALSQLALYEEATVSGRETILQQVASHQEKMQHWARHAPMNFQHKYDLMAAERYRVLEQAEAICLYDRAIAGAKANEYVQEEALANELAAKFYLNWGNEKVASGYMQDAYYCYARWGAKAKTDLLEEKYPQLLSPILQQQQVQFNPADSLETLTQTLTSVTQGTSQSSVSAALDFTSILQAAQTISSTIELEQILANIVQIILTNAGADKTALVFADEDEWQLRAIAEVTNNGTVKTNTRSQALTAASPVPFRLIQYVKNTLNTVLIEEGNTNISGIIEGYLLERQPQSVLCLTLLDRGNLVAILYLEHSTTKGVFTANRQAIVQFLCAQAAISLQNAQLYDRSQKALRDLKQAQLQLVQSEKMSALGNLVAGVAHEINNPTGFLQGNIQPAKDYVKDLLLLIELLLAKCPSNDREIEEIIADIELDFIREDLPEVLESMKEGVDRIRSISNSLRTFSRTDQERKTSFNVHEGIDSTLLILKHRTKANELRPAIAILKDYGAMPELQCFPGQLNQVFMNIIANAIDAFDEANLGKSYTDIEVKQNSITIRTSIANEQAIIEIKDNGCGMNSETKERIFEQGFTTKVVGKGTGLGMAIARQIILEKHGGTIVCDSTFGQGTTFTIALPI